MSQVRRSLLKEAKLGGGEVVEEGDMLVQRKKFTCRKSVKQKQVQDIIVMVCCIQNKTCLPRMTLRNGKLLGEKWCGSQAQSITFSTSSPDDCISQATKPAVLPLYCS